MNLGSSAPVKKPLKLFIGLGIVVLLFVYANARTNINPKFVDKALAATGTLNINQQSGTTNLGNFAPQTISVPGNSYFATTTGNVGIGTTGPINKLDVRGAETISFDNVGGATGNPTLSSGESFGVYRWTGSYWAPSLRVAGSNLEFGNADNGWLLTDASGVTLQSQGTLIFNANGSSEKMRIKTDGNVGIGTASPGTSLQVGSGATASLGPIFATGASTAYISAQGGTNPYVFMGSDGSTYGIVGTYSNHSLGFRTNNNLKMLIDTNGNVGIGTASPVQKLDVAGNIALNDNYFYFRAGGDSAHRMIYSGTYDGPFIYGNGGMALGTSSGSVVNMVLKNTGNVGIGTASPGTRLEVSGADDTPQNAAIQNTRANYPQLIFNATSGGSNAKLWRLIGRSGNDFEIQTLNDSYAGEVTAMQINRSGTSINNVVFPNGSVGIGTASPGTKLDVQGGNIRTSANFQAANTGNNSGYYNIPDSNNYVVDFASGSWGIYWNTAGGTYCNVAGDTNRICFVGGGGDRAFIDLNNGAASFGLNGGSVGIGTASPTNGKLEVSGNIYASGNIYLGNRGVWLDGWLNQNVTTGASPTFQQVYSNDWFRSYNGTGWYNQTYGGGIYMTDSSYVRTYGSKSLYVDTAGSSFGSQSPCCAGSNPTINIGEQTSTNGRLAWINFHNGGNSEAYFRLSNSNGSYRHFEIGDSQSTGTGLKLTSFIQPVATTADPWTACDSYDHYGKMYVQVGGNRGLNVCIDNYWYTIRPGNNDLAEYYPISDTSLTTGDVAAIDPKGEKRILKSSKPYQSSLIGIISTKPGIWLGDKNDKERMIALAGRVPVKVTTENGIIQAGDIVTSSSTQGHAMKATRAGNTIGKAVEDFDPKNGKGEIIPCPQGTPSNTICGKIVTFVNTSWHDPDAYLTSSGDLKLVGSNDNYQVKDKNIGMIERIGAFAEVIVAKLQAGVIEARKLIVDGVDVMERLNEQQNEIDALKQEIQLLKAK